MNPLIWLAAAAFLQTGLGAPLAVTTAADATTADAAHAPPNIDVSRKRSLSPKELADKREGGYFTGLPLVNSDPDRGVGYGVRVFYYYNGRRDDALFAYTPYLQRIYAQYFRTTKGYEYHELNWDAPYIGGTPYRVRSVAELEHETLANYFGLGDDSLEPLRRPGANRRFESAPDFEAFNRADTEWARFTNYEFVKPQWSLSVERDVFGGIVRPLVGVSFMRARIDDYSGRRIEVDGRQAVSEETLLSHDVDAGGIVGFDGGWVNRFNLGIAYDTRDFEPDPNHGAFHEINAAFSTSILGSEFEFQRYNGALRYFYSPFPKAADLVLAGRAVYQVQLGEVPFFEMSTLAFSDNTITGLGGYRTLRGFKVNRFVGPVMALTNIEARWTVLHVALWGQDFAPILVPFVDAGRAFDSVRATSLRRWQISKGLGVRIAWNQATIIMIDYGASREGAGLYVNFRHIF